MAATDQYLVRLQARVTPRLLADVDDTELGAQLEEALQQMGCRVHEVTGTVEHESLDPDALIADLGLAFAKATVLARDEAVDACRLLLEAVAEYLNQNGWGSA